jgi:hypothetical protein
MREEAFLTNIYCGSVDNSIQFLDHLSYVSSLCQSIQFFFWNSAL